MRAMAVTPRELRVVEVPAPEPGPYRALFKTDVAVPCNATDGKLMAGHLPGVDRYPLLPGHEFVTHEYPVERIEDAVRAVASGEVLKRLLRY